jgi:hypothetical protein
MTVSATDVYEVLGLPAGLRLHMARTVGVVAAVGRSVSGKQARIVKDVSLAMALHDVGNVVMPIGNGELLAEPPQLLSRWCLYSHYTRSRYGENAHAATESILEDLGVKRPLIDLVERKSSRNFRSILCCKDPAEMLALYADMRVSPTGVVTILERHEDAVARYANVDGRKGLGGDIEMADLEELEAEIAQRFSFVPSTLDGSIIEEGIDDYLNLDLTDAFK